MKNGIKIATIVICLCFASQMMMLNVSGDTGSIDVPASSSRSHSWGSLYAGTTVTYSWGTDDTGDKVNFWISDSSENEYQKTTRTYSGSNTFSVSTDDTYTMNWYCDNWFDTASIEYEYTITEPAVDSDIDVEYVISENPCPQGEQTSFTIDISNPNDDQIKLTLVGVHFDWQPNDIYYIDSGVENNNPVLASGQEYSSIITIDIENDINLGMHIYDIFIKYEIKAFGNWHEKDWSSGNKLDFSVTERDRDGDGVPDSEDAFPDDPNEWKDTDKDGYGDNIDAFPTDPAAWKDTDGDGYPDSWITGKSEADSTTGLKLDAFPDDPNKYKEDKKIPGFGIETILFALVIIAIISFLSEKRKNE